MMKSTLLAIVAVNMVSAQAPEEATRRLWSNEFAGNRPAAPAMAAKAATAKAAPADYTYLGVTLWRDRPTKPADPEHARAIVFGKRMTAERVDSATVLRQGDSLQIAVESARAGYLYVINREVYRDKTRGEPMLIFPHREIKQGKNRIEPGVQVLIPDGERFEVKRDREDLVGEELTFLVSPKPLGVIAEGEATALPAAKVAEWEKLWKTSQKRIESMGKGGVVTPAEIKAREEGVPLTAQDALPHTMFRVDSKAGAPVLVSLQLNFGNKAPR